MRKAKVPETDFWECFLSHNKAHYSQFLFNILALRFCDIVVGKCKQIPICCKACKRYHITIIDLGKSNLTCEDFSENHVTNNERTKNN